MRRGQIRWVDLGAPLGSEAGKRRPAVVVSNDGVNHAAARSGRGAITVVPVTTNTSVIHPFQLFLPAGSAGLAHDSKAQAEQIRAVDIRRIDTAIGRLDEEQTRDLDEVLCIQLSL